MKRSMVALASAVLFSSAAGAQSINVSTGLDSSNNVISSGGQSDAHWMVSGNAAETVFPGNPDWYSGWVANDSSSDWIAIDANNCCNGGAPYTFTRTFDLTGYSLPTVSLSGDWTIDDAGTLALNGTTLGTLGSGNWGGLTSFSTNSGFLPGLNTLTITMTSDDNFLEGVRLQGTVAGQVIGAVPEPATWAMMLLGFGMIGVVLRRRKTISPQLA